jgi:hypothetical protein
VAEGELLQADDGRAPPGQLPRGRTAERTEADDDVLDLGQVRTLLAHVRSSRGSSHRRMSRLESSIGANHPCV